MFKILKRLLGIEELSEIKIQEDFKKKKPKAYKIRERQAFYRLTGKFYSPIVLDKNNVLIDGYISYLIAKKYNKKFVKVERIKK